VRPRCRCHVAAAAAAPPRRRIRLAHRGACPTRLRTRAGLIHRDLTPSNVFLTHDSIFKIGDFGLSREFGAPASLGDLATHPPALLPSGQSSFSELLASADGTADGVADGAADGGDEWRSVSLPRFVSGSRHDRHDRSVTRGVGTTLYMSPEQRASRPYDFKVDVYALGVIFLELCCPFGTAMERITELTALQRRCVPRALAAAAPQLAEFVLWCTATDPRERPTAEEVLTSPVLSPVGAVLRVSAYRRTMHQVLPRIHETIERVRRVRSFTAADGGGGGGGERGEGGGGEELIVLDYVLDDASGSGGGEAPPAGERAELESLQASLAGMEGVVSVRAGSPPTAPLAGEASPGGLTPLQSPAGGPSSSAEWGAPFRLPPPSDGAAADGATAAPSAAAASKRLGGRGGGSVLQAASAAGGGKESESTASGCARPSPPPPPVPFLAAAPVGSNPHARLRRSSSFGGP